MARRTDDRAANARRTNVWNDETDPIACPECGHVAQWRGTVYRCKEGHESRPPRRGR